MEHKKKHPSYFDASCQGFSDGGLGSFVTISVCRQINLLCLRMARATKYKCSDIVSVLERSGPAARVMLVKL